VVTVQDLAFDDNRPLPPASIAVQWLRAAESSPVLVKYSALLAGLIVLVAFGIRPALNWSQGGAKAASRAKPLPQSEAQPVLRAPEPAAPDPEKMRTQEIFQEVTAHLKREPTQSSRLLQSWIHTEQQ